MFKITSLSFFSYSSSSFLCFRFLFSCECPLSYQSLVPPLPKDSEKLWSKGCVKINQKVWGRFPKCLSTWPVLKNCPFFFWKLFRCTKLWGYARVYDIATLLAFKTDSIYDAPSLESFLNFLSLRLRVLHKCFRNSLTEDVST